MNSFVSSLSAIVKSTYAWEKHLVVCPDIPARRRRSVKNTRGWVWAFFPQLDLFLAGFASFVPRTYERRAQKRRRRRMNKQSVIYVFQDLGFCSSHVHIVCTCGWWAPMVLSVCPCASVCLSVVFKFCCRLKCGRFSRNQSRIVIQRYCK